MIYLNTNNGIHVHQIKMLPKCCQFLNSTEVTKFALKIVAKGDLTETDIQR